PCARLYAQEGDNGYRQGEKGRVEIDANGHRIGPSDPVPFTPAGDAVRANSDSDGPVRLARFAYVSRDVTWRADSSDEGSKGAAQIRFGIDDGTEISVQRGDAVIEGPQGKVNLHAGDYLDLADSSAPFTIKKAPAADSWDRWNDERNRILEGKSDRHVPPN